MTRDLLERMSQPHASDPPPPWREQRNQWPLRLLGAALVAGGVSQGLVVAPAAWAAWVSLGAGLALILRR